jgi:hypothetical protein
MLVATRTCGLTKRARIAAVAAGCAFAIGLAPAPAQAEGFFEALFGGLHRAVRSITKAPKAVVAPVESLGDAMGNALGDGRAPPPPQSEAGMRGPAYCVRLCDGRYFPVQPSANLSSRQMCSTLCPACETKVFYGSMIDNAVSADGTRYPDLPKAYAYRQTVAANCSCNGQSPFGLAKTDVKADPTLRPGDIVVTREGLAAFRGSADGARRFTPVENYPGYSRSFRNAVDRIEVAAGAAGSRVATPSPAPNTAPAPVPQVPDAPQVISEPAAPAQPQDHSALDFQQRWVVDSSTGHEFASTNPAGGDFARSWQVDFDAQPRR